MSGVKNLVMSELEKKNPGKVSQESLAKGIASKGVINSGGK